MTYNCSNCGAPIEGIICPYCNTRNAIDLKQSYPIHENPDRVCPNCDIYLDTLILDKNKKLYIEKCRHCDGIFLDFGELEEIMEEEIKKTQRHNLKRLHEIQNNPLIREKKIHYKKCPQCRKTMLRLNYQGRSGVIIDYCKEHGYWLDSGELRQILEWAKLEGVRDFTPTLHKDYIRTSKIATDIPKHQNNIFNTFKEEAIFDPIVSLFRKIYGF